LIHSLEAIARIKEVAVEAVAEAVVENARRLYGKGPVISEP